MPSALPRPTSSWKSSRPAPAHAGVFVTHVRYKRGTLAGVREAVEIGRRAGVAVHISHLKGTSQRETEELLSYIDNTAVHEVDFSFDIYPYLPGSSMLNSLLPYEVWEDGPLAVLAKLAEPTLRRRFATQLADSALALEQIHIAWVGSVDNQHLRGMSLADYAHGSGRLVADALCDLLIEENLAVTCVWHIGDDSLVEPFLAHTALHARQRRDLFSPRPCASTPIWLGHADVGHARARAPPVHARGSGAQDDLDPGRSLRPFGAGRIKSGAFADLVAFDSERVTDRATFADPQQLSTGIEHVIVNGTPIVAAGAPKNHFDGPPPGRALRYRE